MSKSKKIIAIISIVVIVCSIFIIPVSAAEIYTYNFVGSRPQLNSNSCYFEVVTDGAEPYIFYVSVSINSFGVSPDKSYNRYSVNFETSLVGNNLWVYPKNIVSLDDGLEIAIEGYEIYGVVIRRDGSVWFASVIEDYSINPDGQICGLSIGSNYYCLRAYNAKCYIQKGSNMVFAYGNEINTNSKLDSIIAGIQGGNQQIINSQNQNSQQIQQNQNENTDKVLNGDSDLDSSGQTGKVDGTIGGIDDATQNAMGGKTEEQVQQEISGALDKDKIGLDFTKASRISNFFDNCLNSFGTSYKTLLMLSLCLGLAAFLIGRRYG